MTRRLIAIIGLAVLAVEMSAAENVFFNWDGKSKSTNIEPGVKEPNLHLYLRMNYQRTSPY